jgi:hypothetical protein
MKRSVLSRLVGVCLLIVSTASDAHAQMTMGTFKGYLTGHIGAVTGGDVSEPRMAAGASIAVHEGTGWGAELDFGRSTNVTAGTQLLDLTTYVVNAAWVKNSGIVRPFAHAGAGLIQVDGCEFPCGVSARTYDLGISAGGGTFIALTDFAGLRADARYFFSAADHPELRRPDNIGFWRVSLGATFMWAVVP